MPIQNHWTRCATNRPRIERSLFYTFFQMSDTPNSINAIDCCSQPTFFRLAYFHSYLLFLLLTATSFGCFYADVAYVFEKKYNWAIVVHKNRKDFQKIFLLLLKATHLPKLLSSANLYDSWELLFVNSLTHCFKNVFFFFLLPPRLAACKLPSIVSLVTMGYIILSSE